VAFFTGIPDAGGAGGVSVQVSMVRVVNPGLPHLLSLAQPCRTERDIAGIDRHGAGRPAADPADNVQSYPFVRS